MPEASLSASGAWTRWRRIGCAGAAAADGTAGMDMNFRSTSPMPGIRWHLE
jgi:hypothetical protein